MPERTSKPPRYKTQTVKGAEYAYTNVEGRRISLGRAGTPESHERFQRIVDEWEASEAGRRSSERAGLTVAELAERFVQDEWGRVAAGLISRTSAYAAEYAARALVEDQAHANTPTRLFGPKALRVIQKRLAATRVRTSAGRFRDAEEPPTLSRAEVNRRVNGIRRIFRWGVAEELVPPAVLQSLEAVKGLRCGEARETEPRMPADPRAVALTAARLEADGHLGLANVIRLLRWTGCRPDEVCSLSADDVVNSPDGLELRIRKHKTRKHTGSDRVVPLNREAAKIVQDALVQSRSIDPSRRIFASRDGKPITPNGLYQAVGEAAAAAGVPRWMPYQLRHLATIEMLEAGATEAETAAAIGHTPGSTVVRRYSRGREKLARRAVAGIGSREAV